MGQHHRTVAVQVQLDHLRLRATVFRQRSPRGRGHLAKVGLREDQGNDPDAERPRATRRTGQGREEAGHVPVVPQEEPERGRPQDIPPLFHQPRPVHQEGHKGGDPGHGGDGDHL